MILSGGASLSLSFLNLFDVGAGDLTTLTQAA
jgi:hypothetical protein